MRKPALAAAAGLWRLRRGPRRALPRAPRILVLAYEDQLGSAMAATPMFAALRSLFSEAEITVAANRLVADILGHDPNIDRLVTTANPHHRPLAALAGFSFRFLRERFDLALTTLGCRRAAVGLLALLAPSNRLAGHAVSDLLGYYDDPASFDSKASMLDNNLAALAPFGLAQVEGGPRIHFGQRQLEAVRNLLRAAGFGAETSYAVLVVQTSGGQPTAWFPERMAGVADDLFIRHGLVSVFAGTEKGQDEIEAVRRLMRHQSLSVAGRTSVPELGALMAMADLAVSLDTGAMHVARAAGVPLVVVASAWQPPQVWLPPENGLNRVLSHRAIPCADCLKSFCAHRDCMRAIGEEAVENAVGEMLACHPPALAARMRRIEACLHGRSDDHSTRKARTGK